MTNPSRLRVRRATVDDLNALRVLWVSMRLPADELEKRLTEFQIAETDDGGLIGAIGVQFIRQHALLHSEGYSDFGMADAVRQQFWQRIQTLASHHGVFRLWTQERSPFWKSFGFQPVTAELLPRLPEEWKNPFSGAWLTLQLKNEETIAAALDKEFASFMSSEKNQTARVAARARTFRTVIIVAGFAIGIFCFALALYLLVRHSPFSQ
ncbi:MAG: hypothetical protein KGJ60_13220 [Verrucomicrobiota bacterium]|nr:hypothetical protein [Verrucomicrobiota bacterium]